LAQDLSATFTGALNTINAALAKHKDDQPYKTMVQAAEKAIGGSQIGVAVYESEPSKPFDYFTVRYRDASFELVSHGKEDPDASWRVSREYLEKVAASPEEYIENPAKLDWDWLKDRVGVQ